MPAVLRPSPHDVMNGREIARNNLCDCHFYFLTINDDDFVKEVSYLTTHIVELSCFIRSHYSLMLQQMPGSDYQLSAPKNEPDSPLKVSRKTRNILCVDALTLIPMFSKYFS